MVIGGLMGLGSLGKLGEQDFSKGFRDWFVILREAFVPAGRV